VTPIRLELAEAITFKSGAVAKVYRPANARSERA